MTRYLKTKLMIKSVLQNFDTTDDKVSETLFNVYRPEFEALIDMINQNFTPNDVLKNSGSTEDVSSPVPEYGVLHDVGDSHAPRSSNENDSEGLGGEALESITDDENKCPHCDGEGVVPDNNMDYHPCDTCSGDGYL